LTKQSNSLIVGQPETGHHFWVLTNYRNDVTVKMSYKQWCASPIPITAQHRPRLCGKVRGKVRSC